MADLTTLEGHQKLWEWSQARTARLEAERLEPPRIRLWDGDMRLRGEVAGERAGEYEYIENETGTAMLQLSLDHYLAKWIMSFSGRDKRNVIVTFDKQGARWSGIMDRYRVFRDKFGDAYLEVWFKHDYEHVKHILCWSNPFLPAEIMQFPKAWVIFGASKWCLLMTLFVNLMRLETSLWTLPDNPLDPNEWMGPSFNPATWRNQVKPFPLLSDNSNLTIIFSRFRSWHEVAKETLADAQLTVVCRRYLEGEDPHPFADLQGELDNPPSEDMFSMFPVRHGCLIWDIVDNSEWGTETAFGGSLLTGLTRAVVSIASDGTTEGVDVYTGDATFPGEYYQPGFLGTRPKAPWVVYEEGPYTGIESSEFTYFEATDTSIVSGGMSAPGVNEGIGAAVNMAGDIITAHVSVGGDINIPPIGGLMDSVARPLYSDVFLAHQNTPTLRAMGETLPLPGLEDRLTDLGDFHYYEGWADNADKAFTISSLLAIRAKLWTTRAHSTHTIKVSDAAPYRIAENGHFWLGSRIGTTVLGYTIPDTIFVERVQKIGYSWGKDGPSGWQITIGRGEPKDPVAKAFKMIQDLNNGLGQLGIF